MPIPPTSGVYDQASLAGIYRHEGRRVFATLTRLLGELDLAEEALHEAFIAAAERWPHEGVPSNPLAWLISAGRFKGIDQLRRRRRFAPWNEVIEQIEAAADENADTDAVEFLADDPLRLIFTCCHPSLSEEARIALTLREVCGLTTEAIAHACLIAPTTLAQRIVRAKAKIRLARIPYQVPANNELTARLGSVLRVIYLVFNEGYSASSGHEALRPDLSSEAIRLARVLHELLPDPEVTGLLALMLLHESRRSARITASGDLVPLEEQDRGRWDAKLIAEGCALVQQALRRGQFGAYTLQAAIAAVHAEARQPAETDWAQIVGLYDALVQIEPTPIIALNRAVAIAMRDGPRAGLDLIDSLADREALAEYHLVHAARADLHRRLGHVQQARDAYMAALALARQDPERRYLRRRLAELQSCRAGESGS